MALAAAPYPRPSLHKGQFCPTASPRGSSRCSVGRGVAGRVVALPGGSWRCRVGRGVAGRSHYEIVKAVRELRSTEIGLLRGGYWAAAQTALAMLTARGLIVA